MTNMYSKSLVCRECHQEFIITKESIGKLKQSVSKTKFCPACAKKRKHSKTIQGQNIKHNRPHTYHPDDEISFEEFNRAYERFFAKRGIDVKERFNDDYL